jgi:hypothetical protein
MTHMQLAKNQALRLIEQGHLITALSAFLTECRKDDETHSRVVLRLAENPVHKAIARKAAEDGDAQTLRNWILDWPDCGAEIPEIEGITT